MNRRDIFLLGFNLALDLSKSLLEGPHQINLLLKVFFDLFLDGDGRVNISLLKSSNLSAGSFSVSSFYNDGAKLVVSIMKVCGA